MVARGVCLVTAILIVLSLLKCCDPATVPPNPCPGVFGYYLENGEIHGMVTVPNDYSLRYHLEVYMSVATSITRKMELYPKLLTTADDATAGRPLVYTVKLPIQHIIPRPIKIVFNDRVICTGPPDKQPDGTTSTLETSLWNTVFPGSTQRPRPVQNSVSQFEIVKAPEVLVITKTEKLPQPVVPTISPTNPFLIHTTIPPPTTTNIMSYIESLFTRGPPVTSSPKPTFTTKTTTPPPPPRTTSLSMFQKPPVPPLSPDNDECGISLAVQTLIVHGEDFIEGQYPWLVAIMYKANSKYNFLCSGSLVSKRHVITAAHCVQYYNAPLIPIDDLLLIFGRKSIKDWERRAVTRKVAKIKAHPDYKQNKGDVDVAVLTLNEPLEYVGFIGPICLWTETDNLYEVAGQEGVVAGWVMENFRDVFKPEAKFTMLPILTREDCLRTHDISFNETSPKTFCAGRSRGAGPCNGDNGSAFILPRDGRWTLRGIFSSAMGNGSDCSQFKFFLFTDLATIKDWITQETTTS